MCTYIKKNSTCRCVALTAGVKIRAGRSKTARNEQVCAHQVIQEVNFPNHLWAFMHMRDCSAPILQFFSAASDGATANRQIPNRIFGQFLPV